MTGERWHGTTGGYTNHGCRCVPCSEAHAAYMRERFTRPCVECGKPAWTGMKGYKGAARGALCYGCWNRSRTESVRPDTLRCSGCGEWLPDNAFPRNESRKARRGRHYHCTPCGNRERRKNRAQNLDREREYERARWHRRKKTA